MPDKLFDRILILCIGNICRSPMAEALMRRAFAERGRSVEVHSAGLGALVGESADENARTVMQRRGLDISVHRAQQVTQAMVRWADLVLVMDEDQRRYLIEIDSQASGKVFLLGHWAEIEIGDPYRKGLGAFEEALSLIERATTGWVERL